MKSLFCVIFFVGLLSCNPQLENPIIRTTKKIKAPDFVLADLNGKKITLKGLGGKVVFLDFWATWCPPCIVSVPEIEKLADEYRGRDFQLVSISLDEDVEAVKKFMKWRNMTTQVTMAGNTQVDLQYRVTGLPSFFIIDKQGYLVGAWNGYHPSLIEIWKKEIDRLLEV